MASNTKEVQKKADAKRAGKRARAWTAVVYPDSAPDNWLETLGDLLVEAMVSPLHDMDVEPTGEVKKAHYHVVLQFTNPTTYSKAKEVFSCINAVVPPENACKVKDLKQMARYLCHLDQPNKHRYPVDEVVTFGGFDYQAFVITGSDEQAILDDIDDFIRDHRIVSFATFQRVCKELHPEWKRLFRSKYSFYIQKSIKANYWAILNSDFIAEVEDSSIFDGLEG